MKKSFIKTGLSAFILSLGLTTFAGTASAIIFNFPAPEPGDPTDTNVPPVAPTPSLTREANKMTVRFTDNNANEQGYYIQRRINSGSWVTVSSIGALSGTTYTFNDYGRSSDTYHCYRTKAYNQAGTRYSSQRCAYTKDGNENDIWRIQVEFHTANISNANTNDGIYVRLNSSSSYVQPSRNITWMDYGRNDFERGDIFSYDLELGNAQELGDINRIFIAKSGSDGWCVQGMSLKVNNIEVYNKDFSSEPSGCRWLDNDNGHVNYYNISHAQLRAHPKWDDYNETGALLLLANNGINNAEMTSRIESMVGHQIHYEDLYWGHIYGAPVQVTYGCVAGSSSCSTIHVDLDLAANVNNLPDPSVDVDFDINFQCTGGALTITTSNFTTNVDSSWIYEVLSLGLINLLDGEVEDRIKTAWDQIAQSIEGVPDCNVVVTPSGDIFLEAAN